MMQISKKATKGHLVVGAILIGLTLGSFITTFFSHCQHHLLFDFLLQRLGWCGTGPTFGIHFAEI
jgi:hypothetical protein